MGESLKCTLINLFNFMLASGSSSLLKAIVTPSYNEQYSFSHVLSAENNNARHRFRRLNYIFE